MTKRPCFKPGCFHPRAQDKPYCLDCYQAMARMKKGGRRKAPPAIHVWQNYEPTTGKVYPKICTKYGCYRSRSSVHRWCEGCRATERRYKAKKRMLERARIKKRDTCTACMSDIITVFATSDQRETARCLQCETNKYHKTSMLRPHMLNERKWGIGFLSTRPDGTRKRNMIKEHFAPDGSTAGLAISYSKESEQWFDSYERARKELDRLLDRYYPEGDRKGSYPMLFFEECMDGDAKWGELIGDYTP